MKLNVFVKRGGFLLLSILFCIQLNAQNVEHDLAKSIATNFLATKKGNSQKSSNLVVSDEHTTYNSRGEALLYIFNFEGGGFVIVAADKNMAPVSLISFFLSSGPL